MESLVKYILLSFAVLLSPVKGQDKNSGPVVYKVGSIEDGFTHRDGDGIVLSDPIPDGEALPDGIYFRPVDGKPLTKEEELRIVNGYTRNRRYTSKAGGGGGFGGGFGTDGGFGGGFGFGGNGGASAGGFGGGFGNQGSSSAGGFGFESGFSGNQGSATGGFVGSQGGGAIGGFVGSQGGGAIAGGQGGGATGGFAGSQGGGAIRGSVGNQGGGTSVEFIGSQGGSGTAEFVGIQEGGAIGGFAGNQGGGATGAGNFQFGFGGSIPSNTQTTNVNSGNGGNSGLVSTGAFATGDQGSQGTGGSNTAGGFGSGFEFTSSSSTGGSVNAATHNGQGGNELCSSASCKTQNTEGATVGVTGQLGVGSSGSGYINNQVVTSSDQTLKSGNGGSGGLFANVEITGTNPSSQTGSGSTFSQNSNIGGGIGKIKTGKESGSKVILKSSMGSAKVAGDSKSASGGGLEINTIEANTGGNTGGRIKGSFENTIVGSTSQRGGIYSGLAGGGTFTAGAGSTGSTQGVGSGGLNAGYVGSNNAMFGIGGGTGGGAGQYSGGFGGGFGGGRIHGGVEGDFGASLFDGVNSAISAGVPIAGGFAGNKGYSFSHSTSFGPHTASYGRK